MLKKYNSGMAKVSMLFNNLAALALTIMMVLVVGNVILRLVGIPIQATYDFVEFLTALGIGLALAYCAVVDGHISISLFIQKLPESVQRIIDIIVGMISVILLVFVTYQMTLHAHTMQVRGEMALTTGIPYAPFIYLIAIGFAVFTLVEFGKLLKLFTDRGPSDHPFFTRFRPPLSNSALKYPIERIG